MRYAVPAFCCSIAFTLLVCAPRSSAETAQSASCAAQMEKRAVAPADRQAFMAQCTKGALTPPKPPIATTPGSGAHAVVAPSGHSKTARSAQCNSEADKRGLQDRARAAFRLSCLASAAPVSAIGTATKSPRPTAAKPDLGVKDAAGQH